MIGSGEVFENAVTGERAVVRVGTLESDGDLLVLDLYVPAGSAVPGAHVHPSMEERVTVVRGRVGLRLGRCVSIATPDQQVTVPAGMVHDWWNAGETEAHVVVEMRSAGRFEELLLNRFGLAQDGKTDARGVPGLLQRALLAWEFEDVVRPVGLRRLLQGLVVAALVPLALACGLRGNYPRYLSRPPCSMMDVRLLPAVPAMSAA
jgi:quercetin dioxygenase-like cupin family protein